VVYCGHFWPIVPTPDNRWGWLWNNWWNEDWQRKPKYSEKTCPSATLSTTNPTWRDSGSNPGRRGGKPLFRQTLTKSVHRFQTKQLHSLHYEGPASGQLDQGFPWFSSIPEQMLSWYPNSTLHFTHMSPKVSPKFRLNAVETHSISSFCSKTFMPGSVNSVS
jgi:hypothetical protein